MTKKWIVALSLLAWGALSWADGAQAPKVVISNASKALGAENLKTIEYSGSDYNFAIGQAPNPSSPWPRFNDKTYMRVIDFESPRFEHAQDPHAGGNPPRGGGLQPIIG
jgi:hypothetical protein